MDSAYRLAVLGLLLFCIQGNAAEYVIEPGQSIAAVVQQAGIGDTIIVKLGYYPTHLVITKPLHLKCLNRPTLDGGNVADVIRVKITRRDY